MNDDVQNKTISNDIVFGMAMQQKPDLARRLIALSTDTNEALLETAKISDQKGNKPTIFSKGTRFDIYLATDTNIYDLEMQTRDSAINDIALRARYYASSNDVTELKPGCNYRELKSLTIIFLCTFDPFKKGYAKYIVKERVFVHNKDSKDSKETCEDITDSVHYDCNITKIFFNASTKISVMNTTDSMANVLHLLATNQSTDEFTEELKETAEDIVQKRGKEIMTLEQKFEDIKYYSELEKSRKIAISLLKNGCTPEFVAENTGLPLEEVKELQIKLAQS